ncbi:unnamed protein product [Lepidochelys kempii]
MIQTQNKRQKVVSEFQQLRQFLEEEEHLLLAQLENLEKAIVKIQNDNVIKMSEEISRLSNLISDLEGKCQKPASEFLRDVRSTLSRDILSSELETIRGKSLGSHRPVVKNFLHWGETRLPILFPNCGGAIDGTRVPVRSTQAPCTTMEEKLPPPLWEKQEGGPLGQIFTNGVPPFGVRMEHKGKEVDGVEHKHVQMFSGTGTEVDQLDVLQPIQVAECDSGSRHGSSPTHPV